MEFKDFIEYNEIYDMFICKCVQLIKFNYKIDVKNIII